jgi:Flp pilus assembly protein TadG
MSRKGPSPKGARSGAAAVEFALLAPVLFFIIFGILEWGWFMSRQAIVVSAAQEGGRAAQISTTTGAWSANAKTYATNVLQSAGINTSSATITSTWDGAAPGYVTVTVSVPHAPFLGLPVLAVPSKAKAITVAYIPK